MKPAQFIPSAFNRQRVLIGYYSLLGIITFGIASFTVLTGGSVAGYGHHLSALQTEKAELENYRQSLTHQISTETSLAAIQAYAVESNLETIDAPLTVSGLTAVAQR